MKMSKRSTTGNSTVMTGSSTTGKETRFTAWGRLVVKPDKASATSVWNEIIGVTLETGRDTDDGLYDEMLREAT